MTIEEFAQQAVRILFLGLAALTLFDYLRRPNRTRLQISLLFGCFAPSLLMAELPETVSSRYPWLATMAVLGVVAQPYILLELVHRFRRIPRWIRMAGSAGMLGSWLIVLMVPAPFPAAATLGIVVYFGFFEAYSAVSLLLEARARRGVSRRRMQLASAGSGWLAAVILLAGVRILLPGISGVVGPASQAFTLLSVLSYYAGFTPPRALRRYWQVGELYDFIRTVAGRTAEERLTRTFETLCPAATRAVGGLGSAVWLVGDGSPPKIRVSDFPALTLAPSDTDIVGRIWESRRSVIEKLEERDPSGTTDIKTQLGAAWVEAVPISGVSRVWGVLVVYLSNESLFPEDDLELLGLLAEQAAGAVEGAELFEQQRNLLDQLGNLNRQLEDRVGEREAAYQELEAFSYSVSHDLRAPLRTIHGFSQILLDEHASQLPPEGQRYLRMVHSGAGQLGSLIDDLLTFSRLGRQALERKPVDTRRLVEQIIEHHQKDQPEREVEFALGELPPCEGDPSMIRSVWTNLLSNAVKFTRPRSPGRIEVGSSASPEGQVYFVRDNGVGFDMTYAHKLFGVFQRLHRSEDFEGTGVGLAIVQRVTSRHGGRVWAESKVGEGTTFFFTLGGANGDSNGRG